MLSNQGMITAPADYLKDRLSNLTAEELGVFRTIYHQEWRKAWLRGNGWINLVLGGLAVWMGAGCLCGTLTFSQLMQLGLGALLILQSLSMIFISQNASILRFALVLLIIGVWNLGLAIFSELRSGQILLAALGGLQVMWAWGVYRVYQRYFKVMIGEIPADLKTLYTLVWKSMMHGPLRRDPDTIDLWIKLNRWRGLLLPDRAIYAANANHLIIQLKADANFAPNTQNFTGRSRVYGQINLAGSRERAVMSQHSFHQYSLWAGWDTVFEKVKLPWWNRLPNIVRIPLLLVLAIGFIYLVYMIITAVNFFSQYG